MHTVTIIGVGRVGGALASALPKTKYHIDSLMVRDRKRLAESATLVESLGKVIEFSEVSEIGSDIVLIATQDAYIASVAERLADLISVGSTIFHLSGSLSSSVLAPLADRGCATGSIHPLVSISSPETGAAGFRNSYFCVEGDSAAVSVAEMIVADLGGKSFAIDTEKKPLYHAAAVMACGHLVALLDASIELMAKCGLDPGFSKNIILPLVKSTVDNLSEQNTAQALTGTFARADIETFERHLAALRPDATKQIRDIYLLLGERSLDMALERGADPTAITAIRDRISVAKS